MCHAGDGGSLRMILRSDGVGFEILLLLSIQSTSDIPLYQVTNSVSKRRGWKCVQFLRVRKMCFRLVDAGLVQQTKHGDPEEASSQWTTFSLTDAGRKRIRKRLILAEIEGIQCSR